MESTHIYFSFQVIGILPVNDASSGIIYFSSFMGHFSTGAFMTISQRIYPQITQIHAD